MRGYYSEDSEGWLIWIELGPLRWDEGEFFRIGHFAQHDSNAKLTA